MSRTRRILLIVSTLVFLCGAGLAWRANAGLSRGLDYLQKQKFFHARREFDWYLKLHPNDADALFAMAEAIVKDKASRTAEEAARQSIAFLDQIPTDSELGAKARLQSGRLRFLILRQPTAAEADLKEAVRSDPDLFDAQYMLWKILDLTRRYYLVEPYFRRCFALATPSQKPFLLREWYFSQCSTFIAASQFDQAMGFVKEGEPSDALTEYKRLISFANEEPDPALNHAELASWSEEYHFPEEQWKHFEATWERVDSSTPPEVFGILFDLLMEAGRLDEARQVFESWPEPHEGFDYQKRATIYHVELEPDLDLAITANREAIKEWPGPVDWQLHHRLAGLLVQAKKTEEADKVRTEAKRLELLMEIKLHTELREGIMGPPSVESARRMAEFYRDINRPIEADGWDEIGDQLAQRSEDSTQ